MSSSRRAVTPYQSKGNDNKRVAFYTPKSEGLPLRECTIIETAERRSFDENEEMDMIDNRVEQTDLAERNGSNTSFENTRPSTAPSHSTGIFDNAERPVFDLSQIEDKKKEDDDDNYSVSSAYTYGTVDTTASSESVHSIISRLQSETDRRRRRLMRRKYARAGRSLNSIEKPKSEDPLNGLTVEIRAVTIRE